ncbi:hypothetical protein HK102_008610, partial [Quaeritorhiza haematococci]
ASMSGSSPANGATRPDGARSAKSSGTTRTGASTTTSRRPASAFRSATGLWTWRQMVRRIAIRVH